MSTSEAKGRDWKDNCAEAFTAGVRHGFEVWQVLTLAIDSNWGGVNGVDKREKMINEVVAAFENKKNKIYAQELEEMLNDQISREFHVDIQDGSAEWLSRMICQLHIDCFEKKDFTGLNELLAQAPTKLEIDEAELDEYDEEDDEWDDSEYDEEDDEEDDEDVELTAEQLAAMEIKKQEEDDGWTTVPDRRKR